MKIIDVVLILTLVSEFSVAAKLGCVQNKRRGEQNVCSHPLFSILQSFHPIVPAFYFIYILQFKIRSKFRVNKRSRMTNATLAFPLPAPLPAPVCPSETEKQIAEEAPG